VWSAWLCVCVRFWQPWAVLNVWINRDAIFKVGLGWPREPRIGLGAESPRGSGNFRGISRTIVKNRKYSDEAIIIWYVVAAMRLFAVSTAATFYCIGWHALSWTILKAKTCMLSTSLTGVMDMSSYRPMGACIACLVISVGGVCGQCWSWASSACVPIDLGRRLVG